MTRERSSSVNGCKQFVWNPLVRAEWKTMAWKAMQRKTMWVEDGKIREGVGGTVSVLLEMTG